MKRKRRNSAPRAAKAKTFTASSASPFSAIEEAFFAAGSALFERERPAPQVESFADLDEGYRRRPGLFSRLFARRQTA